MCICIFLKIPYIYSLIQLGYLDLDTYTDPFAQTVSPKCVKALLPLDILIVLTISYVWT